MQTPYINVILPLPLGDVFTYKNEENINLIRGMVVSVMFGSKNLYGIVWDLNVTPLIPLNKIKPLLNVNSNIILNQENLTFLEWVATYTFSTRGSLLKMMTSVPEVFLPQKLPFKKNKNSSLLLNLEPQLHHHLPQFSVNQQQALNQIKAHFNLGYAVSLLEGVTGSGKTEVFLECLTSCFEQGQQALILLPQIILAPQTAARFEQRYGIRPVIWHSTLTKVQRRESWKLIQNGSAKIVIGARSSLFLPYANLGMIIVDEEHDTSYKQEESVIYQARDMAVARSYLAKIPCLLASATPSFESLQNCIDHKYLHVKLDNRYGVAQLPEIEIVDMRHYKALNTKNTKNKWISEIIMSEIEKTVARKEQALLYLNRRGYAPMTLCGECGSKLQCMGCSSWLVYHHRNFKFLCHHCGHSMKPPATCLNCHAEDCYIPCGPGIERVAEELIERFPNFKIAVVSSDLIENAKEMTLLLDKINTQQIDVIVGTQMIAKGHHFSHLTLIGVIDADLGLEGGDIRAREKTYQLLQQVSGRAGREDKLGKVFLQTYYPEHPLLQSLMAGDQQGFVAQELALRHEGLMPPFGRLASLILSSPDPQVVENVARLLMRHAPNLKDTFFYGPSPAPLALVRSQYRWRILVHAAKTTSIQTILKAWLKPLVIPHKVIIKVDIDPYSFL